MAAKNFAANVNAWARKSEARTLAVFRQAVQRTIEEAQTPTSDGGRMRVDTGFLRASGQASLSGLPTGPTRGDGSARGYSGGNVDLVIAGARLGDSVWFGWTAGYARAREAKDGFLRLAAQNWRRTVEEVTEEARRRFP